MTQAELNAIWARYAHRNDLTPDLSEVFRAATQRIENRLLRSDTDTSDILANSPSLYVHAGLMSIHELAQDEAGLNREAALFEASAVNYAFKTSLTKTPPPARMERL